jgi:uncharacterized protein YjiS (DUF1127 family)
MQLATARSFAQTNSLLSHVCNTLAALRDAFARAQRAQRDHEHLLRMSETHLQDIGLRRVKIGDVVDFIHVRE